MNQILAVENTRGKKKKSNIHSTIIIFSVILIIFGIGLTSTGAYSYFKNLSDNIGNNNIVVSNNTKPVITTERENASIINIVVTHDKGITKVTYKINGGEDNVISGDNKMEVTQEVELPSGESTISIIAEDINGVTASYESSYEVEEKPIIKLEQADGKIKATVESKNNIDYITYYWDEDEASAVTGQINGTKAEASITPLEGTHTLKIIAVDINGVQTKKTQKIIGDNKPDIEIRTNGKVFRIIASDDESISKIEYTLNDGEMKTEEVNQMEYTRDVELEEGKNKFTVTVYNKNGLSATSTVEYVKE